MFDILSITGPIYIVITLGFLTTRLGLFVKTDMQVLGKFVLNFALPALVFSSLSQRSIAEIFNPGYLIAYLTGSLMIMTAGYWGTISFAKQSPTVATFNAMGMSCSNSGFVGFPILLLTMPDIAGVSLALNMIVENLVMIPLLLVMAERSRGGSGNKMLGRALVRLLRNPLIIGVVAGFCASLLQARLPEILTRTVSLFSMASGALSLFVIGGTLVGLPVQGIGRRILPIVVGKLLLHPLAVLSVILLLPIMGLPVLDPSLQKAAVLMGAMPMLSIYTILAQAHGQEDTSSGAMLFTTIVSFFTLSGLLLLLKIS
jgi:malonate transporter and related proteins